MSDHIKEFRQKVEALPRERILDMIRAQDVELIKQINRIEWVFKNKLTHLTWSDGSPIEERPMTNEELALLLDPPFMPSEDLTAMGLTIEQQQQVHIASDPVLWAKHYLNAEPRAYQILMLRHSNTRKVLRAGRRLGKALDVDTSIPTPNGWTTMGDLQEGDQVFDETGNPCNVTFATEHQYGRECYEVRFSDGSSLVADADHQWTVDTKRSRKDPQSGSITLTTADMIDELYVQSGEKVEVNYSIDNADPVVHPHRELELDPWLLGLWLGGGTYDIGAITIEHQDQEVILQKIKDLGYHHSKASVKSHNRFRVAGLWHQLSDLNLFGKHNSYSKENDQWCEDVRIYKHIPKEYLQGSIEQRETLLQGLMDSGGTVTEDGDCEFSVRNEQLAKGVYELIQSLGYHATWRSGTSKLGSHHRIVWTPWRPVFSLKRKLERQNTTPRPSAHQRCRYVVSITPVETRPVKCITVDSANSLYLAGENFIPTHNTYSMAIMILHYAFTHKNGRVLVMAPMKPHVGLIYEEVRKLAAESKTVTESITRSVTSPQYEIQFSNQSTVKFFTTGLKSGGKCLTPDHDVLTRDGWKPVADVVEGEEVASFKEGQMIWSEVSDTWQYNFDGELITHAGEQLSFRVTPNHKLLACADSKWKFVQADQLKQYAIPTGGRPIPPARNGFSKDELELWGWWLSEGSGFTKKMARISQVEPEGRRQIVDLMERMGLHYTASAREIRVRWEPPIYSGTNAYNKFIPRELLEEENRQGLLDGLLGGDGWNRREGWEYSSSSHQLANDVQELAVRMGLRANLREDKSTHKPVGGGSPNPHWLVSAYPRTHAYIGPETLRRERYSGKVHCLTVPETGVFLTRHNGLVHITGNSDVARGQEAHLIVLDELDYMGTDDLDALFAMLQQTDDSQPEKMLVGASTPTGRRERFWQWCHGLDVEGKRLPKDLQFTEFYFPSYCFVAGTKIAMGDGTYRDIEDVKVGDMVRTEKGPRRVSRFFEREYSGDILDIKTYGSDVTISTTPEHPFSSCNRDVKQNPSYKGKRKGYDWEWVNSSDLNVPERRNQNSGSWLRYIFSNEEDSSPVDVCSLSPHLEQEDGRAVIDRVFSAGRKFINDLPAQLDWEAPLATLLGWYLAEGSLDKYNHDYGCYTQVEWTLSDQEEDVAKEIQLALDKLDAGTVSIKRDLNCHSISVRVFNAPLALLMQNMCGTGSRTKSLAPELLRAPKEFQAAFLNAYARGDGWECVPGSFDIRTSSPVLARQIRDLGARLGWVASISKATGREQDFGNDQTADSWLVEYSATGFMLGKRLTDTPGEAAVLVKDVQRREFIGKVYNFEVEDTNSYLVEGLLVHNCNPFFTKKVEREMRVQYGEMGYRHEIEADWGEDVQGVYPRRFLDQAFLDPGWEYTPGRVSARSTYLMGVDWDKYGAGPNIVVLEACQEDYEDERFQGKLRVVYRQEIPRSEYVLTQAVDRIIELNQLFQPKHIYVDRGFGEVQVELLHKFGVEHPETGLKKKVKGISFSESLEMKDPASKQTIKKDMKVFLIDNLSQLLENGEILFPIEDEDLYLQLISYVVVRTTALGKPVFETSGSQADHAHDALVLACLAYTQNYSDLMKVRLARRSKSISNATLLPVLDSGSDVEDKGRQDPSGPPALRRRRMTGGRRRSSSRPIVRRSF